jgi:hypothetical protein
MTANALASKPPPFTPSAPMESGSPAAPTLGHVVSVSGSQAIAALQTVSGDQKARVEIGTLVKITTPVSTVIGLVSGLSSPMQATSQDSDFHFAELTLAGEIQISEKTGKPAFRRGVSSSPAIGDVMATASRHELECVYIQPDVETIEVGTLFQDSGVAANLLVNELFGKHFLVVGSTGSGKSYAIKTIMREVLQSHENAHVVILDVHNEYGDVFGDKAECIRPKDLHLPFWLLNFEELCTVLTSTDSHRDAEIEILTDAIITAKKRYMRDTTPPTRLRRASDTTAKITVDTPCPFLLSAIVSYIDEQLGKLERSQALLPYRRLRSRIEALVGDARYSFMFGAVSIEDNMVEILGRLFRMPAEGKPITVLDLAPVPAEILDVVISLIARLGMDFCMWCDGKMPLHLVCEEAHRYAPAVETDRFLPTRRSLARIAKEGRKYGVSLALVTQRPSELDTTIISQCSTIIAMRLSTDRDQDVIRANANEGTLQLLDFLPLLGEREAIVLGQGVPMPMRIRFRELNAGQAPPFVTQGFSPAWKNTKIDRDQVEAVVTRWRNNGQTRN